MNEAPETEKSTILKGRHTRDESATLTDLFSAPAGLKEHSDDDLESAGRKESKEDDEMMLRNYDDVHQARADVDAPPGSVSYMMSLFAANKTPADEVTIKRLELERNSTAPRSNQASESNNLEENTPLLVSSWDNVAFSASDITPKIQGRKAYGGVSGTLTGGHHSRISSVAMPPIQESFSSKQPTHQGQQASSKISEYIKNAAKDAASPTTWIGSFMFLLYHVVFSLAIGSAILRPHSSTSILGLMTKTAALGIIFTSPVYWFCLSSEIPALYPTVDLFLAPFLANLAVIVDQTLSADDSVSEDDNDTVFLATLGVLAAIGTSFSATLLLLANVFKLANMGSYLPFPVICGFFAAVGIMTWTLAISVDTGGVSVNKLLASGDPQLWIFAIIHHVPTVVVASFMKYLGPKNPLFVVMVVLATIVLFYAVILIGGISLDEAKEMGWLWSHSELVYKAETASVIGFNSWTPPAPFGVLRELVSGHVHWGAVYQGMSTAIALGFLYVIRCSVHGAALKKNIPNLARKARANDAVLAASPKPAGKPKSIKSRKFSEAVDIEVVMQQPSTEHSGENSGEANAIYRAKPTNISLKSVMEPYAYSQFFASLVGGFAITPSVAASSTMFNLGAEKLAPQVGAVLLLVVFYLTDFQLVGYIPKPAFSSMLVLAFIDMTYTWFYKSYFRTQNKLEWLVVPLIVVCAFTVDLLSSVFLGIAFSTFIFVTSIFRSGVVKYVANGLVVHSTIERSFKSAEWLDKNGDLIQVMVLQNYLFFGNASSVYNFIGSVVFRESDGQKKPRYLILDLSYVTGIDSSAADVFTDIRNLCNSNDCKLFMSGMSHSIRSLLSLGGFKPDNGVRSKRKLRFFQNLDSALGKSEDMLLESEFEEKVGADRRRRLLSEGGHGFRTALRHIDEEHVDGISMNLLPLQEFTTPIELNVGEKLYDNRSGGQLERGLFFIESGVLKIEHETASTLTGGSLRSRTSFSNLKQGDSLTKIQAKSLSTLASVIDPSNPGGGHSFRVARIGPGWIAGTMETVSGTRPSGDHIAVTACLLHHLPFSRFEEIEKKDPALVLHLYKLLAFLMARRQEGTIKQLATLHSIMSSPANYSAVE